MKICIGEGWQHVQVDGVALEIFRVQLQTQAGQPVAHALRRIVAHGMVEKKSVGVGRTGVSALGVGAASGRASIRRVRVRDSGAQLLVQAAQLGLQQPRFIGRDLGQAAQMGAGLVDAERQCVGRVHASRRGCRRLAVVDPALRTALQAAHDSRAGRQ